MNKFLKKLFGDSDKAVLINLQRQVDLINALESNIQALSDAELTQKSQDLRKQAKSGDLDALMPEAFAIIREAAKRTLSQRHYDVQMMGAITIHRGQIAEMRTGEGKTLTSTAPIYLNALSGNGVHVVTVNDYLAKRDAVWMGQVYHMLGLSVGCIQQESGYLYDPNYHANEGSETEEEMDEARDATGMFRVEMDYLRPVSRKEAYDADITYGTNNQFGFDYLRDNMVPSVDRKVQRELNFAIIDEIDSILIDEARTPLIISAPDMESADLYRKFADIVKELNENKDFNLDEKMRAATLTEDGIKRVEKILGVDNLYATGDVTGIHHLEQALKAQFVFKKDKDYVVRDGEVVIIDEFTGRMMQGRRYSDGLHQAIEAKEGVEVRRESKTMATVTFQNYFRMYNKLSGMTGTAATEAEEFIKIYDLDVTVIPTNKPIARLDHNDRVYKSRLGKYKAAIREVEERHKKGQPVLIGTASIEQNELLGRLLTQAGIPHNLLNAKNHEKEAEFIAQAGRVGAVTIATNMAGRGVDIVLGGNPFNEDGAKKVKDLGGLFVLGTERHESRRIDNQLRGRSGRQGDPGETQFYVSMEDDLMRIFGSDRIKKMMDTLGVPEDQPIQNKMITGALEKAQTRVEGHHFDSRKHLLEYDDVLNRHREAIYERRNRILMLAEDDEKREDQLKKEIFDVFETEIEQVVSFHTGQTINDPRATEPDVDTKEIEEVIASVLPLSNEQKSELKALINPLSKDRLELATQRDGFIKRVIEIANSLYEQFEQDVPDEEERGRIMSNLLLRAIDRLWVEHLTVMRHLRTSIGLRGYGQRDPLVEYKREAVIYFEQLQDAIQGEVANNFFKVTTQITKAKQAILAGSPLLRRAGVMLSGAAKTMQKRNTPAALSGAPNNQAAQSQSVPKVGRNDECPCGSGKKYKKCHGA